jgi:uncharacterized membrane protein YbhN (UPF0104 family)
VSGRPARRWRIVVGTIFYLLLAWFLVRYLAGTDWTQLASLEWRPAFLLLALPLSMIPRLVQPLAWRVLITGYGETPPPYPQITRVYATSWLGRYIPGKLAWIGAKVHFGRAHGVSASTLAATGVAEAGIQMMSALALAFLLFAIVGDVRPGDTSLWAPALVAFVVMIVALAPPVFNAMARWATRALRGDTVPTPGRLTASAVGSSSLLYLGVHAIGGLATWAVIGSVYDALPLSSLPLLTASFLLAGTLGTLAVFAPSGIGVREGILMILLATLLPRPVAAVAVVVLRLWSIGMDLAFYGIAVALDRWRPAAITEPGTARTPASG